MEQMERHKVLDFSARVLGRRARTGFIFIYVWGDDSLAPFLKEHAHPPRTHCTGQSNNNSAPLKKMKMTQGQDSGNILNLSRSIYTTSDD